LAVYFPLCSVSIFLLPLLDSRQSRPQVCYERQDRFIFGEVLDRRRLEAPSNRLATPAVPDRTDRADSSWGISDRRKKSFGFVARQPAQTSGKMTAG